MKGMDMALVDERIQEFITQAWMVNSNLELRSMFTDNKEDETYDYALQDLCEDHRQWLYTTYGGKTVHNYMTKYRNAIRRAGLSEAFLYYMKEDDNAVHDRLTEYDATIQRRQENQYP